MRFFSAMKCGLRYIVRLFWSSRSLRYLAQHSFPDFAALYLDYGTDLPDRLFGAPRVQPLSQKYSCSLETQITSISAAVPARERGVSRSSRTLGTGCGGRGNFGAQMESQGGFLSNL